MQGEVEFPFDLSGFTKKVEEMGSALSSISKKTENFGKTIENSVAKGLIKATAIMKTFVAGFKATLSNMPEIGKAFKLASEIMSREFFFPIRQQIMPYLQKMLDWVRDHRTLFAKWGTSVAQIVKMVIGIGKQLWQVFKDIAEVLTNSLQKGLKTSFKSVDEFINVLSVKVATITMYLGYLVEELMKKIEPTLSFVVEKGAEVLGFFTDLATSWLSLNSDGASLGTVLDKIYTVFDAIVRVIGDSLAGFFEGLVTPLKDLMTPLNDICDSFLRLLDVFGTSDTSGVRAAFKWLGDLVGSNLAINFMNLATALDTVVTAIQTLAQSGNLLKDIFTGNWDALSKDWGSVKDLWSAWDERSDKREEVIQKKRKGMFGGLFGSSEDSVNDGIITKDGKVIHLNSEDNVYAFKDKPFTISNHSLSNANDNHILSNVINHNLSNVSNDYKKSWSVTAPMTMTFNVAVTEENVRTVGQRLGEAIQQSFSDRVKAQMMAGGY